MGAECRLPIPDDEPRAAVHDVQPLILLLPKSLTLTVSVSRKAGRAPLRDRTSPFTPGSDLSRGTCVRASVCLDICCYCGLAFEKKIAVEYIAHINEGGFARLFSGRPRRIPR